MVAETSLLDQPQPEYPTGMVTFLFTDIEGSTPLWERDPQDMQAAVDRHNAILTQSIQHNAGQVFEFIGDAFEAAFIQPQAAVSAAVAAQRALTAADWSGTAGPLRVRMGIHTGPAERSGGHYVGHTLNRAARVMSAAHGGQVLLSGEAAELTRRMLPVGVQLKDLGEYKLKGLSFLEHLYQLVIPDLQHNFPALASQSAPRNNLPVQLTSFIGREKEIGQLKELLSRSRLITLTGSGGVGKTRLSLQLAIEILDDFSDGVWLVELASLRDPARLPHTINAALGLQEPTGVPVEEALLEYFRARRLLLILDNCEHLIEACARLAERILQSCDRVQLLATSREAFGLPGEVAFHLPSLAVPDLAQALDLSRLTTYESVLLFSERAASAEPGFSVTERNAPAVAQISRRLDGIPLAIELAAARVKVLTPEQIAARLDDRFRLLTGGSRGALPRQQTLRASIDWSYSLLTDPERVLFRRLSVFTGGWSLEAAERVCADETQNGEPGSPASLGTDQILDLLASLVDKSLVIKSTREGEARFRRLETVRQYAREKLLESGEAETVMDRHLEYFTRLSEEAAPELWRVEQISWLNLLQADLDNLHAALEWSLESTQPENLNAGLRLTTALELFWWVRGNWREARDRLAGLLERAAAKPGSLLHFSAKRLLGDFEVELGNHDQAGSLYQECLSYSQLSGEKLLEAYATYGLGQNEWFYTDGAEFEKARVLAERSLEMFRDLGNLPGIITSLSGLGSMYVFKDNFPTAEGYLQENQSACRQIGHNLGIAWTNLILGNIERAKGNDANARELFLESLRIYRQAGDNPGVRGVLLGLAYLEEQAGNIEMAREHLLESLHISREINSIRDEGFALRGLGQLARVEGDYQKARLLLDEAIRVFRRVSKNSPPLTTTILGFVRLAEGDLSQADKLFREGLMSARQSLRKDALAMALFGLTAWSGASGEWVRGARWLGAARSHLSMLDHADQIELERFQAAAREALGEAQYQAALEDGGKMDMEQAAAEALGEGPITNRDEQDEQDGPDK